MRRLSLLHLPLALGALVITYPFLWMVITAFKTLPESSIPSLITFPEHWMWHNLIDTFQSAPFGRYLFNTLLVATIVTVCVASSSVMAGYAFARLEFRGKGILFGLVLSTMMIPFEATLIPNFVLISDFGWYNTYAALTVPWCANAFSIFLMRQAFLTLPRDYFDAAALDGCGHLRFLVRVAIPLVMPMLATVSLIAFLASYNALLWPLVVTGDNSRRVLQVGLTVFSGTEGVRVNLLMCASVIVILPMVALYFLAQRFFVEGSLYAGIRG